jgi:hypothetical protein
MTQDQVFLDNWTFGHAMHHGHVENLRLTIGYRIYFRINSVVGQGILNFFEIFL